MLAGTRLLGAGTADTWGHAWGYGWVAACLTGCRLPAGEAPIRFPLGQGWWVVDLPVAVLVAPVTALLGPALGSLAATLVLAAAGAACTAAWVRRKGGGEGAALAAGLGAALSPFARGAVQSGLPDALAVLLVPGFAHLLEDGLGGRNARLAAAAALGAFFVLEGFYPAIPAAIAGAAVALSFGRRALPRAAIAALPALLAFVAVGAILRAVDHPSATRPPPVPYAGQSEVWPFASIGGADLWNFFAPAWLLPAPPDGLLHRHAVYVGPALLLAAAWAAARSPAARGALVVGLLSALVALGPRLQIAGEVVADLPLPGGLFASARHLYRAGGLLGVTAVAAVAAARPGRRWGALVLAAVALDQATGAPLPLRLPTVADPAGAVERWLAETPGPGAVLDLPTDREGLADPGPWPQRTFYLQAVHGRPIASGLYRRAPVVADLPLLAQVERAFYQGRTAGGPGPPLEAPEGERTRALAALQERGFGFVVVELGIAPAERRERIAAFFEGWLGPAAAAEGTRRAWAIAPTPAPAGGASTTPGARR